MKSHGFCLCFLLGVACSAGLRAQDGGGGVVGDDFIRGEVNNANPVSQSDAQAILDFLFLGNQTLNCPDAADTDDNGTIAIVDAIIILNWLYSAGVPPAPPGPLQCGPDPTPDSLPICVTVFCSP
jgi:hypothetical protein